MFVDTHCHLTMLNLDPYAGDLDLALQQARDAGVSKIMGISVDLDDHIALSEIASRHADVGYSVGVHPCEDPGMMQRATVEKLVELARAEKAWALGETGLDYFHSSDFIAEQQKCFARHIVLPKTGKRQKQYWIVVITFLFRALCHLKMHKIYVMLLSKCL